MPQEHTKQRVKVVSSVRRGLWHRVLSWKDAQNSYIALCCNLSLRVGASGGGVSDFWVRRQETGVLSLTIIRTNVVEEKKGISKKYKKTHLKEEKRIHHGGQTEDPHGERETQQKHHSARQRGEDDGEFNNDACFLEKSLEIWRKWWEWTNPCDLTGVWLIWINQRPEESAYVNGGTTEREGS